MRSRWVQAGSAAAVLAFLAVAIVGLLTQPSNEPDRAYELQQRLRCPVCTSVSIAESMSETARAMREEVDRQVAAGRSDEQIIDYFQARYGDWVLIDPPAQGTTLLLWLVPLAAGIAAAALVLLAGWRSRPEPPELSRASRDRVALAVARLRRPGEGEDEP